MYSGGEKLLLTCTFLPPQMECKMHIQMTVSKMNVWMHNISWESTIRHIDFSSRMEAKRLMSANLKIKFMLAVLPLMCADNHKFQIMLGTESSVLTK